MSCGSRAETVKRVPAYPLLYRNIMIGAVKMATELIDYSWARPNLQQVKAAWRAGVIRYLTGSGKSLTTGEIQQIRAAGLTLTLVYETTGRTVQGGFNAGVNDARAALNAEHALGLPESLVYFAVDYDLQAGEFGLLDAYLDGAASVIGKPHTGVYGGYKVVDRAINRGYAAWQTYAWSGGRVREGIRLYQYSNGESLGGSNGDVDFNRTSLADYGQVRFGSQPAPAPADLNALADAVIRGEYGDGDVRRRKLGANYDAVQNIVNSRLNPAPRPQSAGQSYAVKPGDTLSGIAARYGTSWQHLQQLNNIPDANKIYAGQVLRIDGNAPTSAPAVQTYTVRSGDTLSGIAAKYGTSWQTLAAKNNIANPNLIHPGQVIRI